MQQLADVWNVFGNWSVSPYATDVMKSPERTIFLSTHFPQGNFWLDNASFQTIALKAAHLPVQTLAKDKIFTRIFRMNTILVKKTGGTVDMLSNHFEKKGLTKLIIYGQYHKFDNQHPYDEIRSSLFLLAAQTGCTIRLLTIDSETNQVVVSDVLLTSSDCQWLLETDHWKRWIVEYALPLFKKMGNPAHFLPRVYDDHVQLVCLSSSP